MKKERREDIIMESRNMEEEQGKRKRKYQILINE